MKFNKNKNQIKTVLGISMMILSLVFVFVYQAQAAPDKFIYYQGKLTNTSDVAVSDGSYNFTFTLWDAASGGSCVWSSRGTCGSPTAKSVSVNNGIFNTALGDAQDNALSLDFNSNYYLQVQVGSDSPMDTRKQIGGAGFALNSLKLNGQDASYYLDLTNATNQDQIDHGSISGLSDDDHTQYALLAGRSGGQSFYGGLASGEGLNIYSTSNATKGKLNLGGTLYVDEVNSRVGIGTTTPGAKLEVDGDGRFSTNLFVGTTSTWTTPDLSVGNGLAFRDSGNQTIYFGDAAQGNRGNILSDNGYSISFSTGPDNNAGTEKMRIDSAGNVGIGTTAPSSLLHLQQNQNGATKIQVINALDGTSSGANIYFEGNETGYDYLSVGYANPSNSLTHIADKGFIMSGAHTQGIAFDDRSSNGFQWYLAGSEKMRINSSGNVGIGTTTPGAKLDVAGNIALDYEKYLQFRNSSGTLYNVIGRDGSGVRVFNTTGAAALTIVSGATYLNQELRSSTDLGYNLGSSDYRFATLHAGNAYFTSGNVGIGTTTPTSPLHIVQNGTGYLFPVTIENTGDPGNGATRLSVKNSIASFLLQAYGSTAPGVLASAASVVGATGSSFTLGSGINMPTYIFSYDNYTNPELTIKNGNVGIGITAPGYKLDVNGSGRFTSMVTMGDSDPTFLQSSRGATSGSQIILGTSYYPTIGSIQSSARAFFASNAKQTTDNTNAWTKGTLTYSSNIISLGVSSANNSSAFQISHSPANTVGGTLNNFFTNNLFTVLEAGNVGIGTTIPTEKLQVAGGIFASGYNLTSTNTLAATRIGVYTGASPNYGFIQAPYQQSLNIWTSGSNAIAKFGLDGSSSDIRSIFYGNVGIGTTAPGYKLDVVGDAALGTGAGTPTLYFRGSANTNYLYKITTNAMGTDARWRVGAGSDSAPELSSVSDSDTGIRFPGSDVITFLNGSSEKMRIDSSGNIGIGTTTPWSKLVVNDTSITNTYHDEISVGANANNTVVLGYRANGGAVTTSYVSSRNSYPLQLTANTITDTTAGVTIISSGNVGIGTVVPKAKIEVYDTTLSNLYLHRGSTSTGDFGEITFGVSTSELYHAAIRGIRGSTGQYGELAFLTQKTTGAAYATLEEAMRIDNNGNVGIGTTTPAQKLEISGTSGVTALIKATAVDSSARLYLSNDAQNWQLATGTDDKFNIYDGTAGAARVVVDTSGNVGIGLTNPITKLDVNGTGLVRDSMTVADTTTKVYSSFGSSTTNHSLSTADDVLFSGDVEIDGTLYLDSSSVEFGSVYVTDDFQVDGVIMLSDGTATNPSYTFVTDTDTGLFRAGTNTLGITTGGVERMRLDSNGNIGIGTTTPGEKLEISGSVNLLGDASYKITMPTGTGGWARGLSIYNNAESGSATFGVYGSLDTDSVEYAFVGESYATNNLVVRSGNVGIGTTAPESKLDIYNGKLTLNYLSAANDTDTTGMQIKFGDDTTLHSLSFNIVGHPSATAGSRYVALTASDNGWYRNIAINPTAGNVGIGTTTPNSKLEVSGNIALGTNYIWWGTSGSEDTNIYRSSANNLKTDDNFNVGGGILYVGSNNIINSGGVSYFNGGNVGIGTTTPGYKLDVSGGALSSWGGITAQFSSAISETGLQLLNTGTGGRGYALFSTSDASALGGGKFVIADWTGQAARLTLNSSGNVGIGTTTPGSKLSVLETKTDTSGYIYSQSNTLNFQPSAESSVFAASIRGNLTPSTANNITGSVFGVFGDVLNTNTGTLTTSIGVKGYSRNYGTGTVLNAYGVYGSVANDGASGVITNAYGLYAANATKSAGTITNNYGLYVENQTSGTNNFSVYSAGGTNYFSGNVGIGTTNPQYKLSLGAAGDKIGRYSDATHYNSIEFYNSSDGGMYFDVNNPSTGGYNWQTAGASKMVLLKSGNVGIGTTTPGYKLEVNGSFNATSVYINGTSLATSTAGTVTGQTLNWNGSNWAASSNLFNNGTNVGIGTTTPSGKLHVYGSQATFFVDSGAGSAIRMLANNGTNYIQSGSTTVTGTSADLIFSNMGGGLNHMTIKAGGNVGIGTTAPGTKLDVVGSIRSSVAGSGSNYIGITGDNSNSTVASSTGLVLSSASSSNLYIRSGSSGLHLNDINSNNVDLVVGGGNVGIGTTAPGQKLTVTGNAQITTQLGVGAEPFAYRGVQVTQSFAPEVGTGAYGVRANVARTTASNTQAGLFSFYSNPTINATGLTIDNVSHFQAANTILTAGTLNNQYGLYIDNLTGATNNYSIYAGTAKSYFGGNVGIGTTAPGTKLQVNYDVNNYVQAGNGDGAGGLMYISGS